jgi:hypothetical protein
MHSKELQGGWEGQDMQHACGSAYNVSLESGH